VAGMVAVEEEGTSVVSIPIDLKSIDRWDWHLSDILGGYFVTF
jgi:hypothetical protein